MASVGELELRGASGSNYTFRTYEWGTTFEVLRAVETIEPSEDNPARVVKHRAFFYACYANRVRGERATQEPGEDAVETEPAKSAAAAPVGRASLCRVADYAA